MSRLRSLKGAGGEALAILALASQAGIAGDGGQESTEVSGEADRYWRGVAAKERAGSEGRGWPWQGSGILGDGIGTTALPPFFFLRMDALLVEYITLPSTTKTG